MKEYIEQICSIIILILIIYFSFSYIFSKQGYMNKQGQLRCGVSILWKWEQGKLISENIFLRDNGKKIIFLPGNCQLWEGEKENLESKIIATNEEIQK
jgi:hypothetical protein